ncbi:MAG TPA: ABC transporter permease [Bryobacteraceae bacterium]|nr:ABC transporter permease [Bryobacteraceae bacterium]
MFHRRKPEDFSAELRAHLALEADRLRDEGLNDIEARRQAHLNLGNLMNQEERFYEASRWAWLDQLRQDIRYSFRQLRRAPAFTLTAVLTLSLGIGATTAIFTLIHAVLLKSLPVARPEQLYTAGDAKHIGVYSGMAVDWDIFSYDLYRHLQDHTDGFEQLAAFQGDPRRIGVRRTGSPQAAESYIAQYISGNYFSTFGVPAFAGRVLNADDDHPSAAPAAMISYRTWQQKYALDPSVLGAPFQMNGTPVTIVGVAPPDFFGDALRTNAPDFWLSLAMEPTVNHGNWVTNPQLHWLYLMGRIKPGANIRAIEAQMQVEVRQWLTSRVSVLGPTAAAQIPHQTLHLRRAASGIGLMRANYSTGLELLMAISGFVLLIVCANLANLMLVRGMARRRETSISLALGAARSRLTRQALTESVLLAFIGGAAGVAIAFAGTRTLLAMVFTGASYIPISPKPDLAVLAFAFAASLITGLVFGVAPAWAANRANPLDALRGAGRTSERSGSTPQRTLVVMQAALSLVLLAAAGLLTQSLRNLAAQKFGFAPDGRVSVRIDPNLAGYKLDQLEPLYQRIKERLSHIPGVMSASYSLYSPMSGSSWTTDVSIDGQPPAAVDGQNLCAWTRIGSDYFDTVGTRILRGRPILDSDTATSRHVAVVNEQFARRFFPNQDPIGQHFGAREKFEKAYEIVGIAEDAKYYKPEQPVMPMYFIPRPQVTPYDNAGTMSFEARSLYVNDIVLRFAGRAGSVDEEIRRAFAEIDPNLTVIWIQRFDKQVANQFSQPALIARLTSLFGITALLLASIGLYGVTSYSVARRSKEIGIRVALGADRKQVVAMVLRNAYTLIAIGLALGIPLALAMGRVMGSKLYGISWYSPAILAGAGIILAAFALVATIAPARRAASLDPIQTLRDD